MCGIAGLHLTHAAGSHERASVARMLLAIRHRGPDGDAISVAGPTVLGSARLAIVDVALGAQPFRNETGSVRVVFNGEIYNHGELRHDLRQRGHDFHTHSDGEVIAHLYEELGDACFNRLEGQFAIAIADAAEHTLLLARDAMGICPLHWTRHAGAVGFCSEVKGLLEATGAAPRADPNAVLQMAYFGTICAPLTAFADVQQLAPAQHLRFDHQGRLSGRRYWSVEFPRRSEQPVVSDEAAAAGLATRLEHAARTHVQGEFEPTCFLSGGIDSAIIGALLARDRTSTVQAFCARSDDGRLDEGAAAARTAHGLGLHLHTVTLDEVAIARDFPRLIWHGEVPVISTEAVALMRLAGEARQHSKIVLTGEGADEAFGGYLAFRQARALGPFAAPGLGLVRSLLRPLLQHHYGTDCLLPGEARIGALRAVFGGIPAQASEWEFYRTALTPLLAPPLREHAARDGQWDAFSFDREAVRDRHPLHQSLHVAYEVMLPNYLLGAHGDRVFAAQSVEGRYPFLDRQVVSYSAQLAPHLKIRGLQDKHVLRRAAARWLPKEITQRPKRRFAMPFGTPFLGPQAPELYGHLLSPACLRDYGYFDAERVLRVLATARAPSASGSAARRYLERLATGLAVNFVASLQLWHHLFVLGLRDSLAARPLPTSTPTSTGSQPAWA